MAPVTEDRYMKTGMLSLFLLALAASTGAADITLWEIGKPDHNTAKFALGPGNYKAYKQPGLFVVGYSDPKKDWPYVQPGPDDCDCGQGEPQTFEIYFALAAVPKSNCTLELYFADTQSKSPPHLRVECNAWSKRFQMPRGGSDASVYGELGKGRPNVVRMEVPAWALKAERDGVNHIAITTLTGSWVLWDAVRLLAPEGTKLDSVSDFIAPSPNAQSRSYFLAPLRARTAKYRCAFSTEAAAGYETVRIGDLPWEWVRLQSGLQDVKCYVPPVDKEKTLPVVGPMIGWASVGREFYLTTEVTLRPVRKWEIYVLMHSHNDIGYTDIQPNIAKKQARNVLRALELIGRPRTTRAARGSSGTWKS